jgi:hypothetical protein
VGLVTYFHVTCNKIFPPVYLPLIQEMLRMYGNVLTRGGLLINRSLHSDNFSASSFAAFTSVIQTSISKRVPFPFACSFHSSPYRSNLILLTSLYLFRESVCSQHLFVSTITSTSAQILKCSSAHDLLLLLLLLLLLC